MSLLQVMLMIVLIGAITATGFQLLQAKRNPRHAVSQEQLLVWADQAVAAFAAAHSRLPCPADSAEGRENCTSGAARGYLPIATLDTFFDENARSQIGASGPGGLASPLRYAIAQPQSHNAESINLGAASNWYRPLSYDATGKDYADRDAYEKGDDEIEYDAINGLDLCMALSRLSPLALDSGNLHATRNAMAANIAYAVAIDALDDGLADAIAATSAQNQLGLSDGQPVEGGNHDRIRVRTRQSLAQAVGCDLLPTTQLASARPMFADSIPVAALDLAADGVDLDEQVKETQDATVGNAEENTKAAERATAMSAIATVLAGADVGVAGLELAESITMMAKNAFLCAITFGLECWRLPPSGIAIGFNGGALGTSIAALVDAGISLGLTTRAQVKAQEVEAMATAAAEPKEFNIHEAVAQAYIAAEGKCDLVGDAVTCECINVDGEEVCDVKGMRQAWEQARDDAADATARATRFYNAHMRVWSEAELPNRIRGYSDMSASNKATHLNTLRYQLQTANNLVDQLILLDDLKGQLNNYNEQLKLLNDITNDASEFGKLTALACAGNKDEDKFRCKSNLQTREFANTCQRDGTRFGYDASRPNEVPLCYAALRAAIAAITPQIAEQQIRYDRALADANASGATRNVSSSWIPPTYDSDGNELTSGYYVTASPYTFCYPNDWSYCKLDGERIDGCSEFSVYWNYWRSGDYLPLVRTNAGQKWLSYGDAYRAYKELKAAQTEALEAEREAAAAYAEAVRLYEELSKIAKAIGSGENIELWIGPHDILKSMDDRGATGPDRNANLRSEAMP